jgi:hypothetical protein
VRRGASWTAAYHLQLTVAAVTRSVRSSVVPSSSVLLSGPGRRPPRRPLPPGASAGIQRSGAVAVVDTARTPPWRRSPVSGMRRPPSRFVVRDPAVQPSGVQPVRCPGRPVCPASPVSGHPGSSSGGPAIHPGCRPPVQRPAPWRPPVRCPPVRCPPVRCPAVCCPPPSVRSRPSPRTSGGGIGTRSRRPGNRYHRNGSRSLWVAAPSGGWVDGRAALRAGDAAEVARWSVGVSVADPGPGLWAGGRACPLRDQAGWAGVRSARWLAAAPRADEQAPARAGRTDRVAAVLGLVGDHGGWWSWRRPVRVAPRSGRRRGWGAAPARPRPAAGAPGSLPAAL